MSRAEKELDDARAALGLRLDAILGPGEPIAKLTEALTHPSFANETTARDNQRLEFLGDAVLGLCVSELLAAQHLDADEGKLTRLRSALVNAEALARWARHVDLGSSLALGRGAQMGTERDRTNVLADGVEALVAAVYLTRGIEGARLLVTDVATWLLSDVDPESTKDPKSMLQERVQARGEKTPTYRVVSTEGPSHDPRFRVEVLVNDEVRGEGEGSSKRSAEREAARDALEKEDSGG
ncbi:ribonuclease III [soil metagenome]